MESIYPNAIDGFAQLPLVVDTVTEVNASTVNKLRSAILNIENELGVLPSGSFSTVTERLNFISAEIEDLNTDFYINFITNNIPTESLVINDSYQIVGTTDTFYNRFIKGIDWQIIISDFSVSPMTLYAKIEASLDEDNWFVINENIFDNILNAYVPSDKEFVFSNISPGTLLLRLEQNFPTYRLSLKTLSGTLNLDSLKYKRF